MCKEYKPRLVWWPAADQKRVKSGEPDKSISICDSCKTTKCPFPIYKVALLGRNKKEKLWLDENLIAGNAVLPKNYYCAEECRYYK